MAISRSLLVGSTLAVAGALVVGAFVSAPDWRKSGADTDKKSLESELAVQDVESSQSADSENVGSHGDIVSSNLAASVGLSDRNGDKVAPQATTFEDFMALPGARVEHYLMEGNSLVPQRVEEFASPERFDQLKATLAQDASGESQEKAAALLQEFYAAEHGSSGAITVNVSCAPSMCTASFQSYDSAILDQYMTGLMTSEQLPMYTTMEMPLESSAGTLVRRIMFTTDPDANFIDFASE